MASKPWNDAEVAVLERYADERHWVDKALADLPGRTAKAIRSRMQKVRIECGCCRWPNHESAWMVEAANATHRLLEATLRVGRWQ